MSLMACSGRRSLGLAQQPEDAAFIAQGGHQFQEESYEVVLNETNDVEAIADDLGV
jgi:hypothetical protein